MTEVEFIAIRYSGRPALFLRGFKALYLGVPVSCITFGWVTLAMVRIIQTVFGTSGIAALAICLGLTIFYTTLSGLWGVVATDMLLFGVAMTGSIILSVVSVEKAGGIGALVDAVRAAGAANGKDYLSVIPPLGRALPLAFFVALFVQWWAVYYPGAEPGGGGWSAQNKSATEIEERKRLQWLLLGFFIGPFSFVVFWVIPIFLTGYSLLPESVVLIFLIAIPLTFSVAIIKYHLMDINLIIRRSVVYTIILVFINMTYVVISSIITLFVSDINPAFPSVLTALAVVALLQPVKTGVQKFVDKKFFRVEYDYREEQKRFLDDIKNIYYIQSLAGLIVKRVDNLIPVEKIGFFELNNRTGRVKIIANKGWDLLSGRSIRF